jgi:hypothetical protein
MSTLTYYQDHIGDTLTVWYGDPASEFACEETPEEIILMKNAQGVVIGKEILHYSRRRTESLRIVFDEAAVA